MPITLTRRGFLGASVAAGVGGMLASCDMLANRPRATLVSDANRVAIFSDTHINGDRRVMERGVNMTAHLKKAVEEVLRMGLGAPGAVVVNGDLAHRSGESEDYRQFLALMLPLTEAGLPVHLAMGNHDNRRRFWDGVGRGNLWMSSRVMAVEQRQMVRVSTPAADIVMLDSLERTLETPGMVGEEQCDWLKNYLDAPWRGEKPVVVFVHHNPPLTEEERVGAAELLKAATMPATAATTKAEAYGVDATASATGTATATTRAPAKAFIGLKDGEKLLEILAERKVVKALVYGHTHQWKRAVVEGIHVVNVPATSYTFGAGEPTGWVDCRLSEQGMRLELRCTDTRHPAHGDVAELAWRG